jgi:predicted flavoprotein YhiN
MEHPAIRIDLKPTFTHARLVAKMESARGDLLKEAATRWKLGEAALGILGIKQWQDVQSLAHAVKNLVIPLQKPRPIAEAISSAGGVCWSALDESLMLHQHPGIFIAGEMIDWEAPTGGYLMQGCFATGSRAGSCAAAWVSSSMS